MAHSSAEAFAQLIAGASPEQRKRIFDAVVGRRADVGDYAHEVLRRSRAVDQVEGLAPWVPLPHQVPPAPEGDWRGWLLMGGRGSGKSAAATRWLVEHIHGPACDDSLPGGHQGIIIAPTLEDGVVSVFRGPSGIHHHDQGSELVTVAGGTVVRFKNGCEVPIIGASNDKQADRVRARGNLCAAMIEEAAAIPALPEALDNLELGLRLGPHPRWVASTTPKPRKVLRDMLDDPKVAHSRGTIHDNPHLSVDFRKRMADRFAGTRKESQELEGVLLDEVPGALWSIATLERSRMTHRHPDPLITVVGVDPSGSTSETADDTGIVVVDAWLDSNKLAHVAVLADYTTKGGDPRAWTAAAVSAAQDYGANWIVGERNYGGEMVHHVLQQRLKELGLQNKIRLETVTASKGKLRRAEPIAMLWDPTPPRGHIVGHLPELENECCTWIEGDPDSPDRMDALTWAATKALASYHLGISEGPQDPAVLFGLRA